MKKNTGASPCLKLVLASLSIILFNLANGQASYTLNWDVNPAMHSVHNKFITESAVVLLDSRLHEYAEDTKMGVVVNVTTHKLVKVNDDKGIEMYNKVYIPVSEGAEVVSVKARVISPSGKIIDLPQSKVLDVEEEGRKYKKFAYEGVEKGSELEYISVVKKSPYFFGIEYFQSSAAPTQRAEFMLVVPSRLYFDVKGYSNFKVDKDTVLNEKRIVTAMEEDIPSMDEEKYSVTKAHVENIQYKLSYNLSKDKGVRIFTWNELAKKIYNSATTYSDKEDKAAQKFLQDINIPANATDKNFKARCLFMMAKCSQKQVRQPQYDDYGNKYDKMESDTKLYEAAFMKNKYFPQFIKEYSATPFYKEAFNSCSYLRDFIKKK